MTRRAIARVIAVLFIGYGFAFLIMSTNADNMSHYKTLSRDALIAEMKEKNSDSFDGAFFTSLLIVGLITLLVEGLAAVIVFAMNRISPPEVAPVPAHELDVAEGPRFH